mgnify:CR=1 FL=1
MPIIVDEVVISVEISNQAAGGSGSPPSPTDDKQTLVAQCVVGGLAVLATYLLGRQAFDERVGVLAASAFAVAPMMNYLLASLGF